MSEEELVFQLLEEDKKERTKRIVKEREITTEDCLVLGVLRLNDKMDEVEESLTKRIDEVERNLTKRIDETNARIDETNVRIDEVETSLTKRIDETNVRIDEVETSLTKKIDETNVRINARIDEMKESLSKRIRSNFMWTIGLILMMWASTMAILVSILLSE